MNWGQRQREKARMRYEKRLENENRNQGRCNLQTCNDGDIGSDGKMSWYMLVETAASHAKEVREKNEKSFVW